MPSASLPEALRAAERWLLPGACLECGGGVGPADPLFCPACQGRWRALPEPQCGRCGQPAALLASGCRICAVWPDGLDRVRSAVWLDDSARHAVHALKYEGWHELAPELAERMARLDWPADVRDERSALVPVPLAAERMRTRGFNQSAKLADALAPHLGVPVWHDVIERPRATPSQTRLTPEQRLHNVADAFRVVEGAPSILRGAHVILVDDVVTTAATLNECAATLWDAGARIISYVTFGRARAAGDAPLSRG